MSDIKISVVVHVYNAAKFLPRCLDSILGQDYQNLEVICVNDGSQDESLSILHIYAQKDSRVKVISQFNQGAAAARNKGLKNVTGEYVSFIDADDYISQGLYSSFVQAIEHDRVDIFMFNGLVNKKNNFFTEKNFYHPVSEYQNVTYRDFFGIFYGNSSVCNKIFKFSFLKENKIAFLNNCCFEDVDFWFKSLIRANLVKVSFKPYYHYMYDNNASITKNFGLNAFSLFDVFASIMNSVQKQGLEDFFQDAVFQYQYEKIAETLFLLKPEFQEKFYAKAKDFLEKRVADLKGEKYKNLLNYGICRNIFANDFIDFKNSTLLFREKFNYLAEKPKNLRFSVIVPVYNVEAYLEICLKSLINQTFQDFEIICVNDGSTDKSGDILKYHASKDARIKIINQENKGLGAARNVGVAQAQGEYLVFVDSDDWLRTDALEVLDKQLQEKPVEVCIFGYSNFFDNQKFNLPISFLSNLKNKQFSHVWDYMFVNVTAWGKVYKRDFWQKNDISFAEKMFFEDNIANVKVFSLAESVDICWYDFYYYRIRENSITQKFSEQKVNDLFKSLDDMYFFMKKQKFYDSIKLNFITFLQNCFNFHSSKIPMEEKESFLAKKEEFLKKVF